MEELGLDKATTLNASAGGLWGGNWAIDALGGKRDWYAQLEANPANKPKVAEAQALEVQWSVTNEPLPMVPHDREKWVRVLICA